jgi:hypothetical protein
MSFLSDAVGNRQLVLLCARLLVQGAMGWSIPQPGMDDVTSILYGAGSKPIARHEQAPITPAFGNGLSVLRRTGQRRLPSQGSGRTT